MELSDDRNDAINWFDPLYTRARQGLSRVPWARYEPDWGLMAWVEANREHFRDQRALVVGCGLGDDAEYLASNGLSVTAFDVAPSAIDWCHARFPESVVDYRVADLFHAPANWTGAFDFVFESRTVQSLPVSMQRDAMRCISRFVSSSGVLYVFCRVRPEELVPHGPPWPLAPSTITMLSEDGFRQQSFHQQPVAPGAAIWRWRVVLERNAI